jgi:hypothetical protein
MQSKMQKSEAAAQEKIRNDGAIISLRAILLLAAS